MSNLGTFLLGVAMAVFSFILNPKPQQAHEATKENFKFATVQLGESYLVFRGTRRIAPAVTWFGRVKVKKKKISGGKK
jgi:hypothetical protein